MARLTPEQQDSQPEKSEPPWHRIGQRFSELKHTILERTRPRRTLHYWVKKAFDELLAIRIIRFFVQLIAFILLNFAAITWALGYNPLLNNPALAGIGWLIPIFGYIPLPYVMPHGNPAGTGISFFDVLMLLGAQGVFPYVALGVAILVPVLIGRSFCGWICPFGFVQDLCALTPIRTRYPSRRIEESLSSIKYAILGITLLLTIWLGIWTFLGIDEAFRTALGPFATAFWSVLSPAGTIFVTIPKLVLTNNISPYITNWPNMLSWHYIIWIRLIFLGIVIASALVVRRPYCRWICPAGAMLNIFNRFSLLGISRRSVECPGDSCDSQRCQKECPMAIRLLEAPWGRLYSGDCILCLDCKSKCSEDAIDVVFP